MAEIDPTKEVEEASNPIDLESMSLESLILLLNTENFSKLKDATRTELTELKKRQQDVKRLNEILRSINAATDDKGKLDCSKNEELKNLLKEARDLGVNLKEGKTSFTKEEKDRLVENIRLTTEDLKVDNDLQLQNITRLTNRRYESLQLARGMLEPLERAKRKANQGISGH